MTSFLMRECLRTGDAVAFRHKGVKYIVRTRVMGRCTAILEVEYKKSFHPSVRTFFCVPLSDRFDLSGSGRECEAFVARIEDKEKVAISLLVAGLGKKPEGPLWFKYEGH